MKRSGAVAALGATLALLLAATASATTYAPNRFGDHAPNGCTPADCTLREAVTRTNNHAGPDEIVLKGGRTYTLALLNASGDEDANATGDLDVNGGLTIRSSDNQLASVDANDIDRVFETGSAGAVAVVFRRLLIRGGLALNDYGGGALVDSGSLRLVRSRASSNFSDNFGGAVSANGATASTTIVESTISDNDSQSNGAGLGVVSGADANVIDSTISANDSGDGAGGGIAVNAGSLSVTNSSIVANRAKFGGGGVSAVNAGGPVVLRSVTVARNNGDDNSFNFEGGGLASFNSSFTARNSIVARNTAYAKPDCDGTFTWAGLNLLTDPTGCLGPPSYIVTSAPKLSPLASHGGPTKTIQLLLGSPAIDNAGSGSPVNDQRGVRRDASPDIGAFERR